MGWEMQASRLTQSRDSSTDGHVNRSPSDLRVAEGAAPPFEEVVSEVTNEVIPAEVAEVKGREVAVPIARRWFKGERPAVERSC